MTRRIRWKDDVCNSLRAPSSRKLFSLQRFFSIFRCRHDIRETTPRISYQCHEIAAREMVHGGGHHHHHSGSRANHHDSSIQQQQQQQQRQHRDWSWGSDDGDGGWWGNPWNSGWQWFGRGPLYANQNVAIVNNRDRGMGSSYQQNYRLRSRRRTGHDTSDECEQCCRACCLGFCTCCVVTASTQEATKCGPMSHWVFLSICFFILLVVMSKVDETWTFNAGETRHLATRNTLTSQVQIHSQVSNGIIVYDVDGKCPDLTGPTVSLEESWTLHLHPDDYQFDYYFLTKGSSLTVAFQQHRGATAISLLKGESELHAVEGDEDYPSFSTQSLLTRYTAAALSCEEASHHNKCHHARGPPITFTYMVPESDIYIIVYDNASSTSGKANTTIHVDLTTYNLANQVPFPDCQPFTCLVNTHRNNCLLLQAPSDGGIVTAHITAKRRWLVICSIALSPLVFAICLRLWKGRESSSAATAELPPPPPPPPATNPEVVTAPLKTPAQEQQQHDAPVDYESIPIVASEDVVPVAVPVGELTSDDKQEPSSVT